VGYVKTKLSCTLFIKLTTTCFVHCVDHLQVTKMYIEENYIHFCDVKMAHSGRNMSSSA